jgi:hypothetical protein
MPKYMFLLFDDESWFDNATDATWQEAMVEHGAFSAAVVAAGASILGGEALDRSSTATVVRRGDGSTPPVVADGPFIETKEALGGFYIIEARDLDHALTLAAACPAGTVEVRPVIDTSGEAPT